MSRKQRTTTISGEIETIRLSAKEILPPVEVPLDSGAEKFWDIIICARARDSWTDIDLIHGANLANTFQDIVTLRKEINTEGTTIKNDRGTMVSNPKVTQLETVCRRSVALSRTLHVNASATQGRSRDTGARTKKQRELLDAIADDDFLAKPDMRH